MNEPTDKISSLSYDDRRKVLVQNKSQKTESVKDAVMDGDKVVEEAVHYSTSEHKLQVTYSEAGIKLAHKNMSGNLKNIDEMISRNEEDIKKQEEDIKSNDLPEMSEELKQLKKNLEEIQKYAGIEAQKAKLEESKKAIESLKEDRKEIAKDVKELEDTIGTRLKL